MILFATLLFGLFGMELFQLLQGSGGGNASLPPEVAMWAQGLIAAIVSGAINLMKNSNWSVFSWITAETPKIAKALSGCTALLIALGITWTHGDSGTDIHIPVLSLAVLSHAVGTFVVQWVMQHASYEALWRSLLPAQGK